MAQINIKIKNLAELKTAIRKFPEKSNRAYSTALKLSGFEVQREMRVQVPKKTRNLMRSIQSKVIGLRATIGPDLNTAPYAIFIHEGTSPYIIRPSQKKALFWKGARHPVRSVRHPGIKANPFVDRTATLIQGKVETIFRLTGDKLLRDIARKTN